MAQNALFRGVRRADVDRDVYNNALLHNEVKRLPQMNRAQDQQIQAQDMAISDAQKQNAAGVLARNFTLAAQSPRPRDAARALIGSSEFQTAGQLLGLPVQQFTVTDQDTDDALRQQMQQWADALSGTSQQSRVQSTQVLEDGTIAYMTSDGRLVRTNERARNPMQVTDVGGVPSLVNRQNAAVTPLSTQDAEIRAAAERERATTEAAASVVPAEARATAASKSPRLNAAVRRLDRVKAASEALGTGGGPIQGRVQSMVGTPAAQEMEAANAQLINELTALTRIPGVGSQSDLEQRLAQLALPNATQHPSVRARSIQELEAFLTDLGAALDKVGSGGGMPDFSQMTDEQLLQIINGQ